MVCIFFIWSLVIARGYVLSEVTIEFTDLFHEAVCSSLPLYMLFCDVRGRYCFPVLSEVTTAPSLPLYRGHTVTAAMQRHNTDN
jgi:hypothetical protein